MLTQLYTMWSLLAILKCELDTSVAVESKPVRLSNNPIWSGSPLSLDGYELGTNVLILEFVISSTLGRILFTSASVPVGRLNYIHEVEEQSPSAMRAFDAPPVDNILKLSDSVEISYCAYKYRETIDKMVTVLGQIHISVISLKYDVMALMNRSGHKITCLINDVYLGRPQECLTRGNTFRSYYWKTPTEVPSFRGTVTPRGGSVAFTVASPRKAGDFDLIVEYNSDLSLIRMAAPAGMKKHAVLFNHVPDNDAYSNTNALLPIFFGDTDKEPLRIRIFNFGFMPPKCVETTIKWKHIIATRPRTLQPQAPPEKRTLIRRAVPKLNLDQQMYLFSKEIITGMKLLMHYYMIDATKIRIVVLYLHVENFDETLKMDTPQERVTV